MYIGIARTLTDELALSKALTDHNPNLLRSGGCRQYASVIISSQHVL